MKEGNLIYKRVLSGALTGAVNGLFGGGGGMVAVPVLCGVLGYDNRSAHATAILLIAPVCAVSAAVYIINGYFSADIIIPAALGMAAGGIPGALFLNKLPVKLINAVFVAVMLAAGIRMLV